ncbi:MAG: 30S ribosomal protein S6 [Smithellaceae bacterium]|nr:30S ribosomal protein S6 [Smithellaceae bacterium]
MKRYETIFIAKVNQPEEELASQIRKYEEIIVREKGVHIGSKRWGQRKLAYDINKQSLGYYVLVDWAGQSAVVAELERNLKIDDRILKFLTVKKKDKIDQAEIDGEIAALNAATVAPAQTAPAVPAVEVSTATETDAVPPGESESETPLTEEKE